MGEPRFDDDMLMRFADGELDEEAAEAVAREIDRDPETARRVEVFMQTRALSAEAMDGLLKDQTDHPGDERIRAMIASRGNESDPSSVVPFNRDAGKGARDRAFVAWPVAIAASVALMLGGGIGYFGSGLFDVPSPSGLRVANLDQDGLPEALATIVSGEESSLPISGDRFRAIASFQDDSGKLCREFELDDLASKQTVVSVACADAGEWEIRFSVTAASTSADGYAPASSLEALDSYLTAIGAGDPLGQGEEEAALKQLP